MFSAALEPNVAAIAACRGINPRTIIWYAPEAANRYSYKVCAEPHMTNVSNQAKGNDNNQQPLHQESLSARSVRRRTGTRGAETDEEPGH